MSMNFPCVMRERKKRCQFPGIEEKNSALPPPAFSWSCSHGGTNSEKEYIFLLSALPEIRVLTLCGHTDSLWYKQTGQTKCFKSRQIFVADIAASCVHLCLPSCHPQTRNCPPDRLTAANAPAELITILGISFSHEIRLSHSQSSDSHCISSLLKSSQVKMHYELQHTYRGSNHTDNLASHPHTYTLHGEVTNYQHGNVFPDTFPVTGSNDSADHYL